MTDPLFDTTTLLSPDCQNLFLLGVLVLLLRCLLLLFFLAGHIIQYFILFLATWMKQKQAANSTQAHFTFTASVKCSYFEDLSSGVYSV